MGDHRRALLPHENGLRVARSVAASTVAPIDRPDLLTGTGGHELEIVEVRQSATADVALPKLADPISDVEPLKVSSQAPGSATCCDSPVTVR